MALGDPYISTEEAKLYLGINLTKDDPLVAAAVVAASGWVTEYCQRDFNTATAATARVYTPASSYRCHVDDFSTTVGLVVKTDTNDDGVYDKTWTAADYVLKPHNGIEGGESGFPYRTIIAVESPSFPCGTGRARVEVTAKWGWAAVPDKVKQATRILAAEVYRLKDAPLGIAGANDFGPLRVREVPQVAMMLSNFRHPALTGPLVA